MIHVFRRVAALFVSLAILLIGQGLQLTLVPLYASELGFTPATVGYLGSAYFLGFVSGCLTVPRFVSAVGHIRIFLVLVSIVTAALLLLGLTEALPFWLVARLTSGWAMAGLYMIFESWLNESASTENRGVVLSAYTITTLLAIGTGQLLIGIDVGFTQLIIGAAILFAMSAIPVGLSSSAAPAPIPRASFRLVDVYHSSHVAVVGSLVAGLVTSGFWVLGPLVAAGAGLAVEQVGVFMAATVAGGALVQLPIGRLSDSRDRRQVILIQVVVAAVICTVAFFVLGRFPVATYLTMFLFGAAVLPIYSICLAHANDNTQLSLIEVGSAILMVNSVGAMTGPFLFSFAMRWMDSGYFVVSGVLLLVFSLWTVVRIRGHEVQRPHFEPFRNLPGTTQGSLALSESAITEESECDDTAKDEPEPSGGDGRPEDQRRSSRPSGS